eukprot:CAMPEP_0197465840 /NCGR_PEP_ID=MMETSP1175-20131217/64745_1 /TAXON_ID=1003142 /ORGANISM="Triceratium dubium, Strain CCMP147" /LENGTH=101 /DNA_ID=CAMNT_0043001863 /DNA_START=938 /DNA_END=1243 /DNA_ORIENTATION=-
MPSNNAIQPSASLVRTPPTVGHHGSILTNHDEPKFYGRYSNSSAGDPVPCLTAADPFDIFGLDWGEHQSRTIQRQGVDDECRSSLGSSSGEFQTKNKDKWA